jgi:hypothetical protein
LNTYGGTVTGTAQSTSTGTAISTTEIMGSGTSFQHTDGVSQGTATIGGSINLAGATIGSQTTQLTEQHSYGTTTGGAPNMDGNSIVNGTTGFGKVDNTASVGSTFGATAIGGVAGIGGIAAIGAARF